jgi:hypothetical protein
MGLFTVPPEALAVVFALRPSRKLEGSVHLLVSPLRCRHVPPSGEATAFDFGGYIFRFLCRFWLTAHVFAPF